MRIHERKGRFHCSIQPCVCAKVARECAKGRDVAHMGFCLDDGSLWHICCDRNCWRPLISLRLRNFNVRECSGDVTGIHRHVDTLATRKNFVWIPALRLLDLALRKDADGEGFPRQDAAVGAGRPAQGTSDAGRLGAADATPRGNHHVRIALYVVGSHHKHRRRVNKGLGTRGLFRRRDKEDGASEGIRIMAGKFRMLLND